MESLAREAERWHEHENLMPEDPPVGFREPSSIKELHKKFLETQLSLREPLDRKIAEQIEPYLIGLESQIELLKDTDSEGAIQSPSKKKSKR